MTAPIPVNDLRRLEPAVAAEVRQAADRVLSRCWYVLGPEVEAFEEAFARACGTPYCVGVANGTDALELALRALDVGAGDGVVTVANAGNYATTAIRAVGARPVFVDVTWDDMTMDPRALEAAVALGPKAIIATHLYGRTADLPAIHALAARHGIALVEDCAQAHGAENGGRPAGSWGDLGCFSFYPTKNLGAVGDGGAVVTASAELAARIRALRQYGWDARYRSARAGGRNSRLDELQAAVLRAKLPHLAVWNARRHEIAATYSAALAGASDRHGGAPLVVPQARPGSYVAHLYVVRTPDREALRRALAGRGVASEVHYPIADHLQPSAGRYDVAGPSLAVSERCCCEVLTLPCFPGMTDAEVAAVIDAVRAAMGRLDARAEDR